MAHAVIVPANAERSYSVAGPAVRVSPGAAQAIGLALHELFVGSVQRLASSDQGTVAVSWTSDQDRQSLALGWIEELAGRGGGGPPINDRFARTVLSKVTPQSLNGLTTLSTSEQGWRWTVTTKSDTAFGSQIVDPMPPTVV